MKKSYVILLPVVLMVICSAFQIVKTSLGVTVRDEVGNIVTGATVQLFEKEEDYTAEKNVAVEGVTDEKGYIRFKELKAISYFVIVRKDDKDNSGGGERTGKLEEKKINKVTIVIQ
jgi:ABC-type Na+ efflux pump permease subunit